jgi:hypothetical protein
MVSFGFPLAEVSGGFLSLQFQTMHNANQKTQNRTLKRIPLYYSLLAIHAQTNDKLLRTPRYARESECTYRIKLKATNRQHHKDLQ